MDNTVKMPRLGVNDDVVFLGKWFVEDGAKISKGQKLASLETSKETSNLKSDFDGYIRLNAKAGNNIKVGEIIAFVLDTADTSVAGSPVSEEKTEERIYTKKARALLEEHPEVDTAKLPKEGIIKESDILKLIKEPYHIEPTLSNHILIYGRGGLCKDIIDIVRQTNSYQIAGIIDFYYPQDKTLYGVPVLGGARELKGLYEQGYRKIISAVAFWGENYTKHYRKNPSLRLKQIGFELVNIIDRNANIASTVRMGEGNLICSGVYIGPDAKIGSDVVLNVGSIINHDCIVSDHCHIASGAVLAGEVIVGENTLVGQGAVIHAGVRIGSNVTVNNGCIIFKDVPDGTIVSR